MMLPTTIVFTREELWLLQQSINVPSRPLDECEADFHRLICFHLNMEEAESTIIVYDRDVLLIDKLASRNAKDAGGRIIGEALLMKSFRARFGEPFVAPSEQELKEFFNACSSTSNDPD